MKRYKQRFNGMGTMFESDDGEWVKNEDAETTLHWNEDSLFEVIRERNADIERLVKHQLQFNVDCEDLQSRNVKLFTLSVISATFTVITIAVAVLTMLGKI